MTSFNFSNIPYSTPLSVGATVPIWEPMKHPYELKEIIGQGAYGKVYKAYDPVDQNIVAIKEISIPPTQKKLKTLENEIELLKILTQLPEGVEDHVEDYESSNTGVDNAVDNVYNAVDNVDNAVEETKDKKSGKKSLGKRCHPNVICYLDHYQKGNNLYIVTEFIDGISLKKLIKDQWTTKWVYNYGTPLKYQAGRPYPVPVVVEVILEDLMKAVQHLHRYDQIHRDIKPENIIIVNPYKDPEAVLIDLGLACMGQNCTGTGGTPIYMAPERIMAELANKRPLPLDMLKMSDIFSVGASLYELMVGQNFYPVNIYTKDELIDFVVMKYPALDYKWYNDKQLQDIVGSFLKRRPSMRMTPEVVIRDLNS